MAVICAASSSVSPRARCSASPAGFSDGTGSIGRHGSAPAGQGRRPPLTTVPWGRAPAPEQARVGGLPASDRPTAGAHPTGGCPDEAQRALGQQRALSSPTTETLPSCECSGSGRTGTGSRASPTGGLALLVGSRLTGSDAGSPVHGHRRQAIIAAGAPTGAAVWELTSPDGLERPLLAWDPLRSNAPWLLPPRSQRHHNQTWRTERSRREPSHRYHVPIVHWRHP